MPYENNVFINCPFDKDYNELFLALVFAIQDSGFSPRCALESSGTEANRLMKIADIIKECRLGVHDISRVELSDGNNLPRFNMPFECGLFWGCMLYADGSYRNKRLLVLDSMEHRYRATLSDISGQDISVHNNSAKLLIERVRTWLSQYSTERLPGGEAIWKHYQEFQENLPKICHSLNITPEELATNAYFGDYVYAVATWLKEKGY
ncbi:hypothetical protein [Parafilimonas terrae]|uniref:Uncharacterized protein n=1 Tax=Parafilimonas terrae TaxID=1465490 RepID=A0A1I5XGY0_9BACT|nr:hypothetical protein [Parafilimonas terrae]SFQ30917.1 hypothetical protein SAMN05444277_108163 [Parafilimonas terrae]